MADVFENREDLIEPRKRLFDLIDATPHLDWLLLTKRIHIVKKLLPSGYELPKNVWLGTTVENQKVAGKLIKYLLEFQTPSVRFLSCEPLLGPLDLTEFLKKSKHDTRIDWVIAGGESGSNARPMNPDWPAEIQRQCKKAKVPFHFKQWGHWAPIELVPELVTKRTPIFVMHEGEAEVSVAALGKTKTGRSLAGRVWDEFPRTRP